MTIFSQRDKRWANARMGGSALTIGRYGCTTSSISMLSTYFGDNLNPLQTSKAIRYTKDGLIIWESCSFKRFRFWFRQQGRKDTDIKNALADPNVAVILQVANGSHWVVCTGNYAPGVYTIIDPWDGMKTTTMRYKNITGAAYFRKS